MKLYFVHILLTFFITAVISSGCAKKKEEDSSSSSEKDSEKNNDSDTDSEIQAGTLAISDNELAVSFPQGLTVGSFPEIVTTAKTSDAGTILIEFAELWSPENPALTTIDICPTPDKPQPPGCTQPESNPPLDQPDTSTNTFDPQRSGATKNLEAQDRLNGKADNCFGEDILKALTYENKQTDVCYGFDYGIVSGKTLGLAETGIAERHSQNATSEDLDSLASHMSSAQGLVAPTEPSPCMVAKGQEVVNEASARVEGALLVVEGMLCQAKKDSIAEELPAIGESLDLKSVFKKQTHFTVSAATIERLDDQEGREVYHSAIALNVQSGRVNGDVSLNLVHSPSTTGNENYNGVMWIQEEAKLSNQQDSSKMLSIAYSKKGSTAEDIRTAFEIRKANFAQSITDDLVFSDGRIDMNAGANEDGSYDGQANSFVEGLEYWTFDINPFTYVGNIAYWKNPGGNFNEKARGFSFNTKQNDDGTLVGCAHTGASNISIRQSLATNSDLQPEGCFTPFIQNGICGTPGDNQGPQIWKQCYTQNIKGNYRIDTDKTKSAQGFDVLTTKPLLPKFEAEIGPPGDARPNAPRPPGN